MKIITRLEKIENILDPEEEIEIIVSKDGDGKPVPPGGYDIVITAVKDD